MPPPIGDRVRYAKEMYGKPPVTPRAYGRDRMKQFPSLVARRSPGHARQIDVLDGRNLYDPAT